MSRVDEFDSFHRLAFDGVLHVTYALSGDRQVALEATTDAFRRAWRDWTKTRARAPLAYVRTEAWRASLLSRGTHPLRRRHEEDSDLELLDALAALPSDQRRLVVLMTLGNTDLDEASREVGLPAEEGIEKATDALSELERSTGDAIDRIEARLHDLSSATERMERSAPSVVRAAARRGTQRNTLVLLAAAVVAVIVSGTVAVGGDALARQSALPDRQQLGAESRDIVLDARKIDAQDLLAADQVSRLDPVLTWKVEATDEDPANTTPYATCPTQRFADPDPLRVLVRTFTAGDSSARVAQSIEVSRSDERAEESSRRLVRWFADCAHPRVQLVAAYKVDRTFGDFTILRLRSHKSPGRTFTVGLAGSGSVTSTLVHEVDGNEGPDVDTFARALNASVAKACEASGGSRCGSDDLTVVKTDPPRTTDAPGFLGIVDLPPIGRIERVWAAAPSKSDPNPAATPCDKADVTGDDVRRAASRIFVLYQATEVPREFGITETVSRHEDADAAKKFIKRATGRIDDCADRNLTAKVDQKSEIDNNGSTGATWRVRVEVSKNQSATYRVGLVRRGADVAQVTFVTTKKFDVSQDVFTGVVTRAGTRLKYSDQQFG